MTNLKNKTIVPLLFLLALCLLTSCSNQDKSEAGVFFLKGNVQFKEKDYENAIRYYDEAIKKYPGLTDAHLNKGLALAHLGKTEDAYIELSTAIDQEDGFHEARLARAEAAIRLGKLNQAQDDLALLTSIYRDSTRFYLVRGILMVDKNDKSAAYADFDKAILLDPSNQEALVNRGTLLFEDGKTGEAKTDFAEVLKLNPLQKEALNNMGLVLIKEGKPSEALDYFNRLLVRIPNDAFALNNKGEALLKLGQMEEAYKMLNRSLELLPENGHTLKNLGVYYTLQKNYKEAVSFFDRSVALEQHVPGLYGLAGEAHWLTGDKEVACKRWAIGKLLSDSLATASSQQHCR